MNHLGALAPLLGMSVSLHAATGFALLTLRTGRGHAESVLAAGGAAATTSWLTMIGLYR